MPSAVTNATFMLELSPTLPAASMKTPLSRPCAGGRGEAEAPRAGGSPVADGAIAPPARRRGAHDDVAHLLARRKLELRGPRRTDEPIEVCLQVVDLPVLDGRGIEDAVPAVHHVIVERDDHQRGVGHDPAE